MTSDKHTGTRGVAAGRQARRLILGANILLMYPVRVDQARAHLFDRLILCADRGNWFSRSYTAPIFMSWLRGRRSWVSGVTRVNNSAQPHPKMFGDHREVYTERRILTERNSTFPPWLKWPNFYQPPDMCRMKPWRRKWTGYEGKSYFKRCIRCLVRVSGGILQTGGKGKRTPEFERRRFGSREIRSRQTNNSLGTVSEWYRRRLSETAANLYSAKGFQRPELSAPTCRYLTPYRHAGDAQEVLKRRRPEFWSRACRGIQDPAGTQPKLINSISESKFSKRQVEGFERRRRLQSAARQSMSGKGLKGGTSIQMVASGIRNPIV
ncbi:hypothetical protein B0H11DRAFT_2301986 [Mycena galericulata]|nr:hypothetical protein B0H11DRAFT_2301986 [Mycena galericulata]